MTTPVKLAKVREEELEKIVERRDNAELSSEDVEQNLVGLCLSGGALRAASFCLGLTQALQRLGLWRFVDYMSTVSGGGYIGSYLTSSTLKDKERVSKHHQPLNGDGTLGQPARVQRFIYGGQYLVKPWRFANNYLMGVFFINLALFSGLVSVCALIAFLWRCLDYPVIRHRFTTMLGLGDDLAAPFWPFWVFAVAWLIAWSLSAFRRGGDARGVVARYLLALCIASFLIGCALLAGNGDIAGLDKYIAGDTNAIGGNVWGPLVALVIGGLLPFLRPSRLLKSGLDPQKPWERYVFAVASTALLVGLPLVLVGILARENISGYNDHPRRPMIRTDIGSWPTLCSLVLQAENEAVADEARVLSAPVLSAPVLSAPVLSAPVLLAPVLSGTTRPAPTGGTYTSGSLKVTIGQVSEVDPKINFVDALRTGWDEIHEAAAKSTQAVPFAGIEFEAQKDEFLAALRVPRIDRTPQQQNRVDYYLRDFLADVALQLGGTGEEPSVDGEWTDGKLGALARSRTELLDNGEWRRFNSLNYLLRCFEMLGWGFQGTGAAHAYWTNKQAVEEIEDDFSLGLNELLASRQFLRAQLAAPPSTSGDEGKKHVSQVQALRENAKITDLHNLQDYQVAEGNRLLLEQSLSSIFRDRLKVRRLVSIYEDQITRLKWFFGALVVFLVAGMWVDVNAISLHRYYRDRLSHAFIVPRNAKSPSTALSEMDTTEYGAPYHLITGSVGMIRRRLGHAQQHHALRDTDEESDQRWVDNFLFSQLYCGSEVTDYAQTEAYENYVQGYSHRLDLAEVTAISGAALSPKHVNNWLLSFLMVAMNLSLGQYVPNPRAGKPRTRPRVLALLLSLWQDPEKRPYCFVSDGGHCENLGLIQLLKRRCKLIIAADVSCDPEHHFHDLGRAIQMARVHDGIRLVAMEQGEDGKDRDFTTDDLRLRASDSDGVRKGHCKKHYLLVRIKYPDAEDGLLVYIKPSFDGDESPDLEQYRKRNEEFPHTSTTDQLFDSAQVEAYRALGDHIGMQLQYHLPGEYRAGALWDCGAKVDADRLCRWFKDADALNSRARRCPVVDHPAEAPEDVLAEVRPTNSDLIKQMRSMAKETGNISDRFVTIVENEDQLCGLGMPTAVAAIQCAVLDSEHTDEDRVYSVRLLQSLEQNENIVTNLAETIGVLIKVAAKGNPDRVRQEAIESLGLLGRLERGHRERVKNELAKYTNDSKAGIRVAVKKALSNFKDSPRKAR